MAVTVRRWSLGLGCAGLLMVAFLPWVRSGERERNSFELLRSADRLDLIDGALQRAAQLGWLLMPVVIGIAIVALALDRRTIARFGALYVGAASVAIGLLVVRSSLDATTWPAVALVLGIVVVVGALVDLRRGRNFSRVSTKSAVGDVSPP